MNDIDYFKALLPDVFSLWQELSSQHVVPATQSARRFIEKFTGTMFNQGWEFQYERHGTICPPNSGSQLQPQLADAEDEIAERLMRFVMEPSQIRLDFAIAACVRFLHEMDVELPSSPGSRLAVRPPGADEIPKGPAAPTAFTGGQMVFFKDRVELCGAVICGQQRSGKARKALDCLRNKQPSGLFVALSGDDFAVMLDLRGGQNSVSGLIRDLRDQIRDGLRAQANIECKPEDVILSRGTGYRLNESITVQDSDHGEIRPDRDHETSGTEGDDPNRDTDRDPVNDPNDPDRDDTDDTNESDGAAATRRGWILQQLAAGKALRSPDVTRQFKCSPVTAKRDLQVLKAAGKIRFVGAPRTGCYHLTK